MSIKKLAENKGFIVVGKNFELIPSKLNRWYGYVYVMEIDGREIKIGSSLNASQRLANLITGIECYTKSKVTNILVSKPHTNYKENEYFLHKKFATYRKNTTECFIINANKFLEEEFEILFLSEHEKLEAKSEAIAEGFKDMVYNLPRKPKSLADVLYDNFTQTEIEILVGNFMAIFKNAIERERSDAFFNASVLTRVKCQCCGEYQVFKIKNPPNLPSSGFLYCNECKSETTLFEMASEAYCSICDEFCADIELNEREECPDCVKKKSIA